MAERWRPVVLSLAVGIMLGVPGSVALLEGIYSSHDQPIYPGTGPPHFVISRREKIQNIVAILGIPGASVPIGVKKEAQAYKVVVPCNVAFYTAATLLILLARRAFRRTAGPRPDAPDQPDHPDGKSNTVG